MAKPGKGISEAELARRKADSERDRAHSNSGPPVDAQPKPPNLLLGMPPIAAIFAILLTLIQVGLSAMNVQPAFWLATCIWLAVACLVLYVSLTTTPSWSYRRRMSRGIAAIAALAMLVASPLKRQWDSEGHSVRPVISIKAYLSPHGPAKKDDVTWGFRWPEGFFAIKFSIDARADYVVRNLDFTVKVVDGSNVLLGGMAQASKIPGVEFRPPELPDMQVTLKGEDGSLYTLSPRDIVDMSGSPTPLGGQWGAFCPRLPVGSQLRIMLAAITMKSKVPPRELRVFGSYDVESSQLHTTMKFDEVLRVVQ